MALGKTIIKIRNQLGISQTELVDGIKKQLPESEHDKIQGAISALERRDSNTSKYTPNIAIVLNVDMKDLISGEINNIQNNIEVPAFLRKEVKQDANTNNTYQLGIKDFGSVDTDAKTQQELQEIYHAYVTLNKTQRDAVLNQLNAFTSSNDNERDAKQKLLAITRKRNANKPAHMVQPIYKSGADGDENKVKNRRDIKKKSRR